MTITPFASRLRAATWEDHQSAEQNTFLADLTKGRLTVAAHAALTAQHYYIYEALEAAAAAMATDPVAAAFHVPALDRLPALEIDLGFLAGPGWRAEHPPVAGTLEYLARLREIAFTWPGGFVAHHYNRYLGDLSGGQYVARAIGRAYQLPVGGDGLRFYAFPELGDLTAFKDGYRAALDAAPWDELEQSRIIDEVRLAYRLNIEVLADLGKVYPDPFPAEVVAQIMRHMNNDHAADSLLIVQAFGGQPAATATVMSGMDAYAIDFTATVDEVDTTVRVPFAQRLSERAQVRQEVTRMYHDARVHLGLPPV